MRGSTPDTKPVTDDSRNKRWYEQLDAQTYAEWGVDYLKEDPAESCLGDPTRSELAQRDALNRTGRKVLFSLCGWSSWYAPVGASLGNSWRVGPDDNDWNGVLKNIDIMNGLQHYAGRGPRAGPGGWNDPCLLLSKSSSGKLLMTELQTRAQFSMWAVLAAPLLISGSVLNMSAETLATYSNKEVIAVSQDPSGRAGWRIQGESLADGSLGQTDGVSWGFGVSKATGNPQNVGGL
eukprot:Skav207246  [mRNA]  locus=scaffold523:545418:553164:- [translate_table: standard]